MAGRVPASHAFAFSAECKTGMPGASLLVMHAPDKWCDDAGHGH